MTQRFVAVGFISRVRPDGTIDSLGRFIAPGWTDSTVDVMREARQSGVLIPIYQEDRVEIWQLPGK
ncbi:MAG TPA: hypothetical protein VJN39_04995 [Gemmatimonadales bacterium]|nr:hypothetical protein [Gemmatimonadales bacterium]